MKNNFTQQFCTFCPSEEGKILISKKDFKVRFCPSCHVMWCDPLRFDSCFHKSDEHAYLNVHKIEKKVNKKRLKWLAGFAPATTHQRLLEVGCMHGFFLSDASEQGYNVTGLDLSDTAIKLAENILPGRVQLGTLDKSIKSNSFDIICAFNVVEHMDNPHDFLQEASRVLSSGGYLMVETPSQESLYHHVMFFVARFFPNSKNEIGLNPGGHIYKFGKRAWKNILLKNDFKVVMVKSISTPLTELLQKKIKKSSFITLVGLVVIGLLARLTGTGNRVVVVAMKNA